MAEPGKDAATASSMASNTESAREVDQSSVIPVTCAIYTEEDQKPLSKWSIETKLSLKQDKVMPTFLKKITSSFALIDRCKSVNIQHFSVKICNRCPNPTPDFPKGRTFSVDTQDQWDIVLPILVKGERELIGKCAGRDTIEIELNLI